MTNRNKNMPYYEDKSKEMFKMEPEKIDQLQEAMSGMKVQVDARLTKGEILKVGIIAGGAAVLCTAAYSEIRGWFWKRKMKKDMDRMIGEEG